MKKNLLFFPLFAALALTGCSKDETAEVGSGISDGEPRYIAVSIATTPSLGEMTRADNRLDENGSYTQSSGSYEDGLAPENVVNKVRFYFFTETGAAMSVRNDNKNYYDYTPNTETNGQDHEHTVSKALEAVVVINTSKGDRLPSSMVAVINPTADMDKSMSLLNLQELYGDYSKHDNGFMMSNSVYFANNGDLMDDTTIYPAYYCTDDKAAAKNPIRIYVERCMAKVRVQLGAALEPKAPAVVDKAGVEHNLIALKYLDDNKTEQPLKIGTGDAAQQVYVELLGWNVDGTRDNAYAFKELEASWNTTIPAGLDVSWNLPQLHRCFWAKNSPYEGNTYYNYNQLKTLPFTGANYTYCNENAARGTSTLATSVVVPARLCDATGASLTICEYAGVRFVDDENLTRMRTQVAFRLKNSETFFWTKVTGTDGTATWRQLDENDITFTTFYDAVTPGEGGRYYAKAQLTDAAKKLEWFKNDPSSGAAQEKWNENEIKEVFESYNRIKIWKSGMTYYGLFIPHMGTTAPTEYGVVRNHVYAITLKNVYGLGTPVFNPDQKIIPEKVSPDNVYVAAKVELLSWRLVSKEVTLDWGK